MRWEEKSHNILKNEKQSKIDFLDKLNLSVQYIENNLDNIIDYGKVSQIAGCSVYNFQRFFSYMANVSLSEYIRRRRLTVAAFEIQNSNLKIIDIAIKFGYDTSESFSRAFKNLHGVSPKNARNKNVSLKAYPCITFNILIKGDDMMNYRIEERENQKMYGVETEISTIDNQNFISVPRFWETCRLDGTLDSIHEKLSLDKNIPLHAAIYNCTEKSNSYMIGYFVENDTKVDDLTKLSIPSSLWAVFSTDELNMLEVSNEAGNLWKKIFTEWFATSGYELMADIPEMELHFSSGNGKFITEIWIPIVKNKNI